MWGQVFKLSRGGLPEIISLMQLYLPLLIQQRPTSVWGGRAQRHGMIASARRARRSGPGGGQFGHLK